MPTTSSARWLAGMTAGVGALGVIAVIVTLLASSGDPEPLPPGSPEARVQDFIYVVRQEGHRNHCREQLR